MLNELVGLVPAWWAVFHGNRIITAVYRSCNDRCKIVRGKTMSDLIGKYDALDALKGRKADADS